MTGDRVAIITGSSRGIGAATAGLLSKNGFRVCVNYRSNEAEADSVVAEISDAGSTAIAVRADVSRESDVVRLFETVDDRLGPVDALVNNAGIVLGQTRVEDMDAERVTRILATNVTGAFLCCREAVRRMSRKRGGNGGSIVNAASKGALDTLTRGLAVEVAPDGIRVNSVRPGFIYTDMHADGGEPGRVDRLADSLPMKRGGQPIEVANTILWLLSDEASYVTGSFVEAGGGR